MKKLMIVAAVAMLGISANAVSYAWGIVEPDAVGADGETLEDGMATALLFAGTIGQTATDGGKFILDFSEANLITSVTEMDWNSAWGETFFAAARKSDLVPSTEGGEYAILLVEGTGYDKDSIQKYQGNYALYGGIAAEEGADVSTGANFAGIFYADDAVLQGDWKVATSAVPEPTSGLLLLVGLGALALRRRRA